MAGSAQRFLWACPAGSAEAGNSKRWKLPQEPCPESISILNEWCQAMSPHVNLRWDFNFLDAVQMESDAATSGRPAPIGRTSEPGKIALRPTQLSCGTGNYKGQLNNMLHKILKRPVVAGDVIYEIDSATAPFTATVVLAVDNIWPGKVGERRFTGVACSAKKASEQSAAAKACDSLKELVPSMPVPLLQPTRSLVSTDAASASNFKGQLVEQLQQLLGRTLKPGDVVFTTQAELPPFVTSIEVRALAGAPSLLGTPQATKKVAEQNAAKAMVERLEREFAGQLKKRAVPGPKALLFSCTVTVHVGEKKVSEAASESGRAFCAKQSAKESAAWSACDHLSRDMAAGSKVLLVEQIAQLAIALGPPVPKITQPKDKPAIAAVVPKMEDMNPETAKMCQQVRQSRGWTPRQLADRAKVPETVVQRLESEGVLPTSPQIDALNRALGVSLPRVALQLPRPVGLVN
eukprot:gb/GFBE01009437.1/.p1 GENE.gb/GFBE01009437.1/~~gb/GFBE01009437.1/.p1  ORF type:complete len:462 (+),score=79.98 gb/GFBE01009437.1/:1-1386(+)